jgi:membrane-associated phospholipid phosphatase
MGRLLKEATALDTAVYEAVAGTPSPFLDDTMTWLSDSGDMGKVWFAVAAGMAVFGGPTGRRAALRGTVSLGIASAFANLVAKPLTSRRRPRREERREQTRRDVPMPESSSFPSGHSASAFAFATGAGQVLPASSAPLRALATLVAYSRVHAGVHYPVDVLVGAFIGVSSAEVAARL